MVVAYLFALHSSCLGAKQLAYYFGLYKLKKKNIKETTKV